MGFRDKQVSQNPPYALMYLHVLQQFSIDSRKTKVNKEEFVIKPGKHQRSKQRCQDLGWKVYDRANSFLLRSYTMHELRNQDVSIG